MLGTMPCLDRISSIPKSIPNLEPELEKIYSLLTHESISLDAIAEQTELNTSKILAILSQLEIMDLISQLPGMRYQIKQ